MKSRPIIFSGPMVRAILEGRKDVTRRVIRKQPPTSVKTSFGLGNIVCPYGFPGDELWVREAHFLCGWWEKCGLTETGEQRWHFRHYEETAARFPDNPPDNICTKRDEIGWFKRPSIFMPRWASRITLEVVDVRAERLWKITPKDARREGIEAVFFDDGSVRIGILKQFQRLWNSINGKKPGRDWASNPWVWRIEFKVKSCT